jgi:hypothetical protein
LEAVDSSYWEIASLSGDFLDFMEDKYGRYETAQD